MIIDGEKAVYHVMSRTALDGFPLKDVEKDFMLELIKRFSALYFIVPAILRTRASSDQRNLWLKITADLNIYFIRNTRKSQNQSKVWMGCIH